jgi:ABC-type cobalamin/Fe3+-siderophores transport system ATPase subunit
MTQYITNMETAVELTEVSFYYPDQDSQSLVFDDMSGCLPAAMTAVVGQNGVGKSTLLLLAGGRVFPQEGSVEVLGTDIGEFRNAAHDPEIERERNRLVSFIYQNMEFETTESVGDLMRFVYENGFHSERSDDFLRRLQTELELDGFLTKRTQEISKGQLQRAIIAFSLLYGSRIIMMDEPVFALEEPQKDRVFGFLLQLSRETALPIYFSVHNLELSRKYSDYVVLFTGNGTFSVGETDEMLTRDRVEAAYSAPIDTLHRRDRLYREILVRSAE